MISTGMPAFAASDLRPSRQSIAALAMRGHVLMDDRVDCAGQQERLGLIVEVVTDHDDGLRNARRLQRGGNALLPAAHAIDAEQIRMAARSLH